MSYTGDIKKIISSANVNNNNVLSIYEMSDNIIFSLDGINNILECTKLQCIPGDCIKNNACTTCEKIEIRDKNFIGQFISAIHSIDAYYIKGYIKYLFNENNDHICVIFSLRKREDLKSKRPFIICNLKYDLKEINFEVLNVKKRGKAIFNV